MNWIIMRLVPLTQVPLVRQGDDIPAILSDVLAEEQVEVEDDDVLVVAQSIISKAEGSVVDLDSVEVGKRAEKISEEIDEDPRRVQVILDQTAEIVRQKHVLISRTQHGFVCADAGVDGSNVDDGKVTLLPEDPDRSAEKIKVEVEGKMGKRIAVVISDSWGRPFRLGAVGFAIGVSGIRPLKSLKGRKDIYGRELRTTVLCPVDSIAAAASLVMGEADEGIPAVLVKDVSYPRAEGSISDLIRDEGKDLFG
ncbi:MAG: coenzyme F420-0:L-glutamate ligase [Candidatus Hadarchaeota archaeon]